MPTLDERIEAPERIWIEEDSIPYYYQEDELPDAGSPVTEYIRADLVAAEREWLRGQIAAIVAAYDRTFLMHTADFHSDGCGCLRCEIDRARAALAQKDPAP